MHRQLYGTTTIPDDPNTFNHQSTAKNYTPRYPLYVTIIWNPAWTLPNPFHVCIHSIIISVNIMIYSSTMLIHKDSNHLCVSSSMQAPLSSSSVLCWSPFLLYLTRRLRTNSTWFLIINVNPFAYIYFHSNSHHLSPIPVNLQRV